MSIPLLQAVDLHFSYRHGSAASTVLSGASLQIKPGEVLALLGANGSGKSTLMRLLLGLLSPQRGEVRLQGRGYRHWSRQEVARQVAYVPQVQTVPFPYRVRDLVALGRIPHRGLQNRLTHDDWKVVDDAIAKMGISALAERIYTELSGGQQQLCLIARALAQQAPLILMDEPISALDYGNQWRLLTLIQALSRDGYAIIKTTHQPEHALRVASRVALLYRGTLIAQGPPQEVINSDNLQRLYGLNVALYPLADGHVALMPDLCRP